MTLALASDATAGAPPPACTQGEVSPPRSTLRRPRAQATSGSMRVLDFVAFTGAADAAAHAARRGAPPHRRHARGGRLLALPARGRQERARDARQRRLLERAIGQVRLRVGEGITGEAVEYMRPVSTDTAEQHAAYKHFAELGEERFPVFLAVPIRGKSGPLGALVVQRQRVAVRRTATSSCCRARRPHRRGHPPRRAGGRGPRAAGAARRGRHAQGDPHGAAR